MLTSKCLYLWQELPAIQMYTCLMTAMKCICSTQNKNEYVCWLFPQKGKENMALTEVYGIKVNGFWPEHKGAKYLEPIYDMLSMKAKSWSECTGRHYIQFKMQYEFLLEYWLLSGTKRLHLFKPCWQGGAVCSLRYPETLKA